MATCPKCEEHALSPTLIEAGLSARGCGTCEGLLVDLVGYRAWSDQQGIDTMAINEGVTADIADTKKAVLCPNCLRIMTKFRVSTHAENRLDFCGHCDVAWLDGGEWGQLQAMGLRAHLGSIFSAPWQRRLQESQSHRMNEQSARERFDDDYDQINEFRLWLSERPDRDEIIGWIAHSDP